MKMRILEKRRFLMLPLLFVLLVDQFNCQESASCQITSITKYSDSQCSDEVAQSFEDQTYISQLNNLITSGNCHSINSTHIDDKIKLKLDCLSNSSIRIQFYNQDVNDENCRKDTKNNESTLDSIRTESTKMLNIQDGSCTQMESSSMNNMYYKFRIGPSSLLKETQVTRQLQAYGRQPAYQTAPNRFQSKAGIQSAPIYPTTQPGNSGPAPPIPDDYFPTYQLDLPSQSRQSPMTLQEINTQYLQSHNQPLRNYNDIPYVASGGSAQYAQNYNIARQELRRGNNQADLTNLNQGKGQIDSVNDSSMLGMEAIIGIAVGGACFLILCFIGICMFMKNGGKQFGEDGRVVELNRRFPPYMDQEQYQGNPNLDSEGANYDFTIAHDQQTFQTPKLVNGVETFGNDGIVPYDKEYGSYLQGTEQSLIVLNKM